MDDEGAIVKHRYTYNYILNNEDTELIWPTLCRLHAVQVRAETMPRHCGRSSRVRVEKITAIYGAPSDRSCSRVLI